LWQAAYVYVLVIALFLFVGAAVATLYQRWKSNGIVTFFVGLGLVMVGAAWLITVAAKWSDVGAFFVRYQVVGTASWSLVLTALAAVFGFLVLRRATPK
jgi:Na+/phosphate symporter